MLKQRMHNAYRDVRLESRRTLKRAVDLLAETNRAYRELISLKKKLTEIKEEKLCVAQ